MSIRLRLTLLYSTILALTLLIFGAALYTIQAQTTMNALKQDLSGRSDTFVQSFLRAVLNPFDPRLQPPLLDWLSGDQAFRSLREREIIRVLDRSGALLASPMGGEQRALPLSAQGMEVLQSGRSVWETGKQDGTDLLIYNRPVLANNEVVLVIQVAHPLTERNRSLAALRRTLIATGLLTTLAAFGIGWLLAGFSLRPIHRITQTAEIIGNESDFTRRVDYHGPSDEVGHLARTFNAMLSRLQDAYQRVRQSLQMQQDFVADVSHELRTPLTTVRGNLALLRRDPPLPPEEQADILDDLVDESDRLIRLVNDLLVLARADSQRSLVSEPVQMAALIQSCVNQMQQIHRLRQFEVAVSGSPCASGDGNAIRQVLLILLDNAVKHTHGPIRVSVLTVGERVELKVEDEGPGIPPEAVAHIFDRFYRASDDPSVPGFGLGLAIAKALLEAQGGEIRIDSVEGQGVTAAVTLQACGPDTQLR
jgi:two-component system, OmpR family, sensor kinase